MPAGLGAKQKFEENEFKIVITEQGQNMSIFTKKNITKKHVNMYKKAITAID